jgi:branched-chain amino acid transport system ATP-binding protein
VVGIVGSNGAGKTTFVNLVTAPQTRPGPHPLCWPDITAHPPREVTRLGIARSFQIPQIYTSLTVLENVLIVLAARQGESFRSWVLFSTRVWEVEALEVLESFGLVDYAGRPVGELPEGGVKFLDVVLVSVLMSRVFFLDEPTSGVSSKEKFAVMDTLVRILAERGVTAIFVEHDMEVVTQYAERILVFHEGSVIADGAPQVVLRILRSEGGDRMSPISLRSATSKSS